MAELRVNIDDPYYLMLESLKPVTESVVEDDLDFEVYVNMVLWRGIRGIIEDIIPEDPQILRKSILMMYESNPEFVAAFMTNVLEAGTSRPEAKERIGFLRD
jgi:hypothetical protein